MAIVKSNNYIPGQNLTDLALNVDYDRLGEDKIQITVNFAGAPATVTIHKGSVWECNGNRYMVTGADYTFQMDGAGHNYITFTDNPAVDFGSSAAIGTFSSEKQGYYQADNVTRTMKFYVDQANSNYYILLDNHIPNLTLMTRRFDRLKVGLSGNFLGIGTIQFDTVYNDLLGSWDALNYQFVCVESGYYFIVLQVYSDINQITAWVLVNATIHIRITRGEVSPSASGIIYLNTGDVVNAQSSGGRIVSGEADTFLQIARIL